ncbi:hypothetical protein [Amycolatopsis sp. TNS106]|uniref:hypothetical protein n=1 Tax=Amycolatopsis sp. TNS106 TaxID=2861750 RepID=UPI001C5704EE|nr:hypothetical protein [Amycolatopsis sp. TNS106]QXV57413.1 hypothetical protein CVV72_10695 [Amycolatopsis sp. TNS106]
MTYEDDEKIAALIRETEAAGTVAFDNLDQIADDLRCRNGISVTRGPLAAVFETGDSERVLSVDGMLKIGVGESSLSVCAGACDYSIAGTDCGRDWSQCSPGSRNQCMPTFMIEIADGRGAAPVSVTALERATLTMSIPYGTTDGDAGQDGHQRLRAYVDGWIAGHL